MKPLIAPRVNMNGSAKETLLTDHMAALHALDAALEAIGRIMPNGRDYQTMPDSGAVTTAAREAMLERRAAIHQVRSDIESMAIAIVDQGDNRSTGMPRNAPHDALRNAVNRAIAEGGPVYVNKPAPPIVAKYAITESKDRDGNKQFDISVMIDGEVMHEEHFYSEAECVAWVTANHPNPEAA